MGAGHSKWRLCLPCGLCHETSQSCPKKNTDTKKKQGPEGPSKCRPCFFLGSLFFFRVLVFFYGSPGGTPAPLAAGLAGWHVCSDLAAHEVEVDGCCTLGVALPAAGRCAHEEPCNCAGLTRPTSAHRWGTTLRSRSPQLRHWSSQRNGDEFASPVSTPDRFHLFGPPVAGESQPSPGPIQAARRTTSAHASGPRPAAVFLPTATAVPTEEG